MRKQEHTIRLSLALGGTVATTAQDGQLSQYEAAPVMLNPALTGMYENADFRMSSNVRSQWNSLSNSFLTTAFAYDISMEKRYGFGTYLNNYNMAGIMNTFQWGATAAYNVSDPRADHTLSVGVTSVSSIRSQRPAAAVGHAVQRRLLRWRSSFGRELPERCAADARSRLGRGLPVHGARKRLNPFGNFALFHITTPDEAIFRDRARATFRSVIR